MVTLLLKKIASQIDMSHTSENPHSKIGGGGGRAWGNTEKLAVPLVLANKKT